MSKGEQSDDKEKRKNTELQNLGVFGGSIEYAALLTFKRDNFMVPRIVRDCILHINENGLDSDGIYRLSGQKSKIEKLKNLYDKESFLKIDLTTSEFTINDIAGVLKLYFRELGYSIIPESRKLRLNDILNYIDDVTQFLILLKEFLFSLSASTFCTLGWLMLHLKKIADNAGTNRMSCSNLAIIFSPCLGVPYNLVCRMISHSVKLFPFINFEYYENVTLSQRIRCMKTDQYIEYLENEVEAKEKALSLFSEYRESKHMKKVNPNANKVIGYLETKIQIFNMKLHCIVLEEEKQHDSVYRENYRQLHLTNFQDESLFSLAEEQLSSADPPNNSDQRFSRQNRRGTIINSVAGVAMNTRNEIKTKVGSLTKKLKRLNLKK